ncbi:MAG TPA: citrate synthase [Nitrospiria bacterium]|nr:citrate synthase [Nitrospiria bacterium]
MIEYVPGLSGVPVSKTKVSYLDGQKGILEYRGLRIETLAEKGNFIETAFLLLFGKLPDRIELERFSADVRAHRKIKFRIIDLIKCLPENGHPMDALQAAVAALGMFYPTRGDVRNPENQYWSAVRLIAKLPTIVAAEARIRRGDEQISPRDDLSHAENFLYMLTGRVPEKLMADILDTALILHAEHTMNASTFSGMVTASTLADPYTVVSSAVGTLKGPLHGGANEEVLDMLQEIGSVQKVRPYLQDKIARKEKIMGLGHREYKVKDPRGVILQGLSKRLFDRYGASVLYPVLQEVERVAEELLSEKKVHPNVDFYSGIVYQKMGIEADLFTPIFAMARVVGWLAHWIEQVQDNHLFRPVDIYEGKREMEYVPLEKRD